MRFIVPDVKAIGDYKEFHNYDEFHKYIVKNVGVPTSHANACVNCSLWT